MFFTFFKIFMFLIFGVFKFFLMFCVLANVHCVSKKPDPYYVLK